VTKQFTTSQDWRGACLSCVLLIVAGLFSAPAAHAESDKLLTLPLLTTIERLDPSPTNLDVVRYQVNFSTSIQGLLLSNFDLITDSLNGASLLSLTGSGTTYVVSVATGDGDGTLRVDLSSLSGVTSLLGLSLDLTSALAQGAPYLMDKTAPLLSIVSDFGTGPGEDFTTGLSRYTLEGTTSADTVQVLVNGTPIDYTPGSTQWSAPLNLSSLGPVVPVAVTALDAAGNVSELASLTINYDPLHDADGNGLPDQLEHVLGAILPTNPLDPDYPPRDWFVSASSGSDLLSALDGGGSASSPWQSLEQALGVLTHLSREGFPVRILLDDTPNTVDPVYGPIALYDGPLKLAPFITLEPLNDVVNTAVHLQLAGDGGLIDGAEGAIVRNLVLRTGELVGDVLGALLRIVDVSMLVEDVVFDGLLRPGSLGVHISGANSSGTIIRRCEFRNLGTGIYALDSGVALADNTFDTIIANGPASVAVAIDLSTPFGKLVPNLGSVARIEETGFNRFRNLAGYPAVAFLTEPGVPLSAQYNDWGVYTPAAIEALIEGPAIGQKDSSGSTEYEPYVPEDKAIIPGSIVGVVLQESNRKALSMEVAPGALVSESKHAMCDEDGMYFFDVLPDGNYNLFARAVGYDDSQTQSVRVRSGSTTEAQRILLEVSGGSMQPGDGDGDGDGDRNGDTPAQRVIYPDINGDGRVNAIDVQLVVNGAIGLPIPEGFNADVNRDGVVNALDVQTVIRQALAGYTR